MKITMRISPHNELIEFMFPGYSGYTHRDFIVQHMDNFFILEEKFRDPEDRYCCKYSKVNTNEEYIKVLLGIDNWISGNFFTYDTNNLHPALKRRFEKTIKNSKEDVEERDKDELAGFEDDDDGE
jgi:hypothetical protein